MSIDIMSLIFKAKIENIKLDDGRTVSEPVLKFILVALADHCNDDGESAYPSLSTLETKTGFTHRTVLNALEALKKQGLIIYAGVSRRGTSNYSINVEMIKTLVNVVHHQNTTSKPDTAPSVPDTGNSESSAEASKPGLPEPSFNLSNSSFNQEEEKIQKIAFDYWQTILEQIRDDRSIPLLHYGRLSEAVPLSMTDHTLIIQIDEPELYNARYSKTLERNIFHALVPGGKIIFQKG